MERNVRFFNSQFYKCPTRGAYLVQKNPVAGWVNAEAEFF